MESREEPNVGKYKEIMNYWNCDGSCSRTSYNSNLELKMSKLYILLAIKVSRKPHKL